VVVHPMELVFGSSVVQLFDLRSRHCEDARVRCAGTYHRSAFAVSHSAVSVSGGVLCGDLAALFA
jgi:hypothetical protein